MNINRDSGSAHVILVSVLVIIILGLLGFVFWQNYVQKKPVSSAVPASNTANSKAKQEVSNDDSYLLLSDWGVMFKKTSLKSEAIESKVGNELGVHYEFITKRVQSLGENCAKADSNGMSYTLAAISRSSTKNDDPIGSEAANNNEPINGYYYYVSAAQSMCSETSKEIQSQDRTDLVKMLLHPVKIE